MPKEIKEIYQNPTTGDVTVEYSDDSTKKFNIADTVTTVTDPVTGGVASSTAFSAARAATYIPFGDSRVANGSASDVGVSTIVDSCRAPHVHLQALLGGRIKQIRNAGVAGNNTAQMLARIDDDVIAYSPGWCFLEGPVNDILRIVNESISPTDLLASMQANVKEIYRRLTLAGIRFATGTISPWKGNPAFTAKQYGVMSAYNKWIKSWCAAINVPCADVYETNVNPADGKFISGSAYDTHGHYSDWGAFLAAMAWFNVLDPVIPKANLFGSFVNDFESLIGNSSGAWTVGVSLPTGWSATGTNITGQSNSVVARADGVQGSLIRMAGTASVQGGFMMLTKSQDKFGQAWVASSSAFGVGARCVDASGNQHVVITAGTTGASQPAWATEIGDTTTDGTVTWARARNFVPGDTIYAEAEVIISGVSGGNLGVMPQLVVQHVGGGGNLTVNRDSDKATRVAPYPAGKYILRSRPYVIGSGATGVIANVLAFLDNGVTATVDTGRIRYLHV